MKKALVKLLKGYMMYQVVINLIFLFYVISHKVEKVHGINVYHVPFLFKFVEAKIAFTSILYGVPVIIVDDEFMKIRESKPEMAEFIIFHEIGHHKLGHIKENLKMALSGKKPERNIYHEIEADMYAVQHTSIAAYQDFCYDYAKYIEFERINKAFGL